MVDVLVTRPYGVGNAVQAIPALRMLLAAGYSPTVLVGDAAAKAVLESVWVMRGRLNVLVGPAPVACKHWISLWPWDGALQPVSFERRHGYTADDREVLQGRYGDSVWSQNETRLNAEIVADFLGLKPGWELPSEILWSPSRAFDVDPNLVGIHPGCQGGAQWERKRWPFWLELIRALCAAGKRVRVYGCTKDDSGVLGYLMTMLDPIGDLGQDGPFEWYIDRSVVEAASSASDCAAFISNDSGMAHLAVAGGCQRVVVLYGPTRPEKNTHGPMVPVVAYGACKYQPCYSDHFSDEGLKCQPLYPCMAHISVARVLREVGL